MKFIKHQDKYYKIERELTLAEINQYKKDLQAHLDTLEKRKQEWAKIEKEKVVKQLESAYSELQELNNLT